MSANIESVVSTLEELQLNVVKSFATLNQQIAEIKEQQVNIQKQQKIVAPKTDELAPFHAWLQVELTQFFGAKDAKIISDKLNRSRVIGDFHYFIPVYKLTDGDLTKRQLLKTVSAMYRYKFGGYKKSEKYALRSEIKYAAACPHCGALATILLNRLIAEGLWKW